MPDGARRELRTARAISVVRWGWTSSRTRWPASSRGGEVGRGLRSVQLALPTSGSASSSERFDHDLDTLHRTLLSDAIRQASAAGRQAAAARLLGEPTASAHQDRSVQDRRRRHWKRPIERGTGCSPHVGNQRRGRDDQRHVEPERIGANSLVMSMNIMVSSSVAVDATQGTCRRPATDLASLVPPSSCRLQTGPGSRRAAGAHRLGDAKRTWQRRGP